MKFHFTLDLGMELHGEQEIVQEVLLVARDWELDWERKMLPVRIWYGEKDPLVSPAAASRLAALLPDAELILVPEAGHYLLYSHWREILCSIRRA